MAADNHMTTDKNGLVFTADYLAAKKYIDDTALNLPVLQALCSCLRQKADKKRPLRILEVGGGIGTMLTRLVEQKVLPHETMYWLTDNDADLLTAAHRHLNSWGDKRNAAVHWATDKLGSIASETAPITIRIEKIAINDLPMRDDLHGYFDLLVAHGVLDLFAFHQVMAGLLICLNRGGLCYFTCNYDGETIFLPKHPADSSIITHYHGSMEKRVEGASRTGRELLAYLQSHDAEIIGAGSSDWVIYPTSHGYQDGQDIFLHRIIDMMENELKKVSKNIEEHSNWIEERRRQLQGESLTFIAKNLDILARPIL